MSSRLLRYWPIALIAAAGILAFANVWIGPGILNTRTGGDSPFLLQRVYELVINLRAGVFPARWMPDAAYGLGYPFFHFYAALPYYLAAVLNLLGFDLLVAIKLTQTLGMLAAAGTMFLWARSMMPRAGAALAALAYLFAPYHLVNVYVRGDSLQEFFAFVWFPLILWGVDRVIGQRSTEHRTQNTGYILLLSLAVAALVLTHNVSALIFAPFIVLYAFAALAAQAARATDGRLSLIGGGVARLALAAVLAAVLSAWFWLPALGDAPLVQLGDQTSGYFNFANHFRGADLVQPGLVFNYRFDTAASPFAMGLAQAILAVSGGAVCLVFAWRRRHIDTGRAILATAWATLFILATLMITPVSLWLWEQVPLLSLAQFPWRFLSVQAVFASILTGGLMLTVESRQSPVVSRQSSVARLFIFPLVLLVIQSVPGLPNDRLDIRAEDVTPRSLKLYEWFTGNIGTSIRAEYLPATAQPRPLVGPDVLDMPHQAWPVQGDVISSTLEASGPTRQVWRVKVGSESATFTLPLLYWPAWRARSLDGAGELAISPYIGSGWVMLTLPRGEQRIELWLDATPLQRIGEGVSTLGGLTLLVVLGVVAVTGRRARRLAVGAAVAGVGLIVLVFVARLIQWIDPPQPPAMQTMDYVERPFAHRAPLEFVDAAGQHYALTGAVVSPLSLRSDEPFTLTTAWKDGRAPAEVGLEQELPAGGYFAMLFRYARAVAYGDPQASAHTALTDALPGPLLLKLRARDAAGRPMTPTVASTYQQGGPILAGLSISASQAPVPDQVIRVFPNGIVLHKLDWIHTGANSLCLRATWSTRRWQPDALKVALRLYGADGRQVAVADGEPQAGLAPTWSWPVGVPIGDSYCVPAVDPLKPGEPYVLLARLYRVLDGRVEGEVKLAGARGNAVFDLHAPQLAITQHRYDAPVVMQASRLVYGGDAAGAIRLRGFDLVTATQSLSLTLYWQTQSAIPQDYKMFVHLSPLDSAQPLQQADRLTLDGFYPTGVWLPGEIVSDAVSLRLDGLPAGRYRLAVGWYDPNTFIRLPARDGGQPVPNGWAVLAEVDR